MEYPFCVWVPQHFLHFNLVFWELHRCNMIEMPFIKFTIVLLIIGNMPPVLSPCALQVTDFVPSFHK